MGQAKDAPITSELASLEQTRLRVELQGAAIAQHDVLHKRPLSLLVQRTHAFCGVQGSEWVYLNYLPHYD